MTTKSGDNSNNDWNGWAQYVGLYGTWSFIAGIDPEPELWSFYAANKSYVNVKVTKRDIKMLMNAFAKPDDAYCIGTIEIDNSSTIPTLYARCGSGGLCVAMGCGWIMGCVHDEKHTSGECMNIVVVAAEKLMLALTR